MDFNVEVNCNKFNRNNFSGLESETSPRRDMTSPQCFNVCTLCESIVSDSA